MVRINKKTFTIKNNGFNFNIENKTKIEKGFYIELDINQGEQIINENISNSEFVILDVRTKAEFEEGHLFNATQLDFKKLDIFIEELEKLDKEKTYFVYCRTDRRSRAAVEYMHNLGFKNIYVMLGGYTKWVEAKKDKVEGNKHKNKFVFNVKNLKELYNNNENINLDISLVTEQDFDN